MIGKDIPEGQGSIISLLSECYDLTYELRTNAEEAQTNGENSENVENVESAD